MGEHNTRVLARVLIACLVATGCRTTSNEAPPAQAPPDDAAGATVLRWDFSTPRELGYTFQQDAEVLTNGNASSLHAEGNLDVKVRTPGTADIAITRLALTMTTRDPKTGASRSVDDIAPPMVITGVQPNGGQPSGIPDDQWYIRALFPFPDQPLAVGDSADIPLAVPFNAYGSKLLVRGSLRVSFDRYLDVAGHRGAQLSTVIDIAGPEVPPELEGEYAFRVTGKGVTVLDLERGAVDRAELSAVLELHVTPPATGGEAAKQMSLRQQHVIRLGVRPPAP